MQLSIICLIFILGATLFGQAHYEIDTYHGQKITKDNILDLAPRLSMNEEFAHLSWMREHEDVLKRIMSVRLPLSQVRKETKDNNAFLREHDITNLSGWNYVFPVDVGISKKLFHISSPIIRRGNIGTYNYTPCDFLNNEQIDKLVTTPTYQTVSALAHYLRLREFFEQAKPNTLGLVATYALRVPWASPGVNGANDDESIIILQDILNDAVPLGQSEKLTMSDTDAENLAQQFNHLTAAEIKQISKIFNTLDYKQAQDLKEKLMVPADEQNPIDLSAVEALLKATNMFVNDDLTELLQNLARLSAEEIQAFSKIYHNLTNEEVLELYEMVKYVGYWDNFKRKIMVRAGKLYPLDFEQPGNSNPKHFFHKDPVKYAWNTVSGIKQIAWLTNRESGQYEWFKNIVLNDPYAQDLAYFVLLERFYEFDEQP